MSIDVARYIKANAGVILGAGPAAPSVNHVTQRRSTSVVHFCDVHFAKGHSRRLVLKYYDDDRPSRLESLRNEFEFATANAQYFNAEDIGIPEYLHFDPQNELVVLSFVSNSRSFEGTLLRGRKSNGSAPFNRLFYNSGRWLSCFHSRSAIAGTYTPDHHRLSSGIQEKWLRGFLDEGVIRDEISRIIDNAVNESQSCSFALLHKEYAPGNILHVGDRVYGIDFGTMESGCILDDIAFFVVATLVLNKYPFHPLYRRVDYDSAEIAHFLKGYLSGADIREDLFGTQLFRYFLYKNLIRRISSQLATASKFPLPIAWGARRFIHDAFRRTRKWILPAVPHRLAS